jgi:hypothetical protein
VLMLPEGMLKLPVCPVMQVDRICTRLRHICQTEGVSVNRQVGHSAGYNLIQMHCPRQAFIVPGLKVASPAFSLHNMPAANPLPQKCPCHACETLGITALDMYFIMA